MGIESSPKRRVSGTSQLRWPGLVIVALALVASPILQAQGPPSLAGSASKVTLDVEFAELEDGAGSAVEGLVRARIEDGWHINSVEPNDEFAIPTSLEIRSDAVEDVRFTFPPHEEHSFEFAGGETLAVYDGVIEIPFTARRTASAGPFIVSLYYQACNDAVCLPPREEVLTTELGSDAQSGGGVVDAVAGGGKAPLEGFTPLSDAPAEGTGPKPGVFGANIAATFESYGLLLTLAAVFVLGLALNLTPCVYPLIPITVGYFSSQKQGSRAAQVALSVSYVLGIAATYSALGVFSALSGALFGAWLQSSAVLVFLAILMLVLAASMFGLYDIQPPQFITRRAGARGGYLGALTMGLLAGIIAAPCVGPFVISLIALVAQLGSVPIGFLLFFVLALGLGVPYLLLGIFSTAANSMPRSGLWMVQVKKAFGFILIALAFYFLRPVVGDEIYRWGIALTLLIGAGFLIVSASTSRAGNIIRFTAAILLLAGGIFFAIPPERGESIDWRAWDPDAIEQARAAGKPVVIDFYADWCIPCKELDALTFSDEQVIEESERFVRLKADLTRPGDPVTVQLTREFDILGVPTIVFLDSAGREVDEARLVGFEKAEPFLERMSHVQ